MSPNIILIDTGRAVANIYKKNVWHNTDHIKQYFLLKQLYEIGAWSEVQLLPQVILY